VQWAVVGEIGIVCDQIQAVETIAGIIIIRLLVMAIRNIGIDIFIEAKRVRRTGENFVLRRRLSGQSKIALDQFLEVM